MQAWGKDLGIESEGGYVRLTNHFSNSIDGLIEYDFLKRGYNKARYIVLGINKFIKPSVKIQFNYRKLFTEYGQEKWNDAIQIQLQFVY